MSSLVSGGVDLYWLPLGVRGRVVRYSGKVFEFVTALISRRARRDLYHSVLDVRNDDGHVVIEMGPAFDDDPARRGVVAAGSVGVRGAGRSRLFRYEIRCWAGGVSAFQFAVGGPHRLTDDEEVAEEIVRIARDVPTPVWGRDELRAGEMWTCNSLTSWLLARVGLDGSVRPPASGRAPGWDAGITVARRQLAVLPLRDRASGGSFGSAP